MTREALEKAKEIEEELTTYKNTLDSFHISIHKTSLTRDTEIAFEKEAERIIRAKLKARIEDGEKELEAL